MSSQAMNARLEVLREVRHAEPVRASNGTVRAIGLLVLCSCNHFGGADPAAAKPSRARHAAIGTGVLAVPDETIELRATVRGIVFATVQTAIGEPGWIGGHHAIVAHLMRVIRRGTPHRVNGCHGFRICSLVTGVIVGRQAKFICDPPTKMA